MSDEIQLSLGIELAQDQVSPALSNVKKSASEASKGMSSLKNDAEKALDGVAKKSKDASLGVSSLGSAFSFLKSPLTIITGGIAAMTAGAVSAVSAFVEAEQASQNLAVALETAGFSSQETKTYFEEYAAELQKKTKYAEEDVLAVTAQLAAIGNFTEKGLKEATKATINLASATGKDLSTAAELMIKLSNGQTEALRRSGIVIEKGATNAETFGNALNYLAKFSGDAEKKAETLGGSLIRAKNAFGEISEGVGEFISKIFQLPKVFSSIADSANSFADDIKNITKSVSGLKNISLDDIKKEFAETGSIADTFFNLLGRSEGIQVPLKVEVDKKSLDQAKADVKTIQATGLLKNDIQGNQKAKDEALRVVTQIEEATKNAGLTNIQAIQRERDERLKALGELLNKKLTDEITFLSLSQKLELDAATRIEEIKKQNREKELADQKQKLEEYKAAVANAFSRPFDVVFSQKETPNGARLAAGLGVGASVLSGKEGARSLLSGGVGAIADLFAPGLGQAAAQIFSQLSQGPDQTRMMVKGFIDGIPDIIQGFIDSIPVLIEELASSLPKLTTKLLLIFSDPKIGIEITKAMVGGVGTFISETIKSLPQIIRGLVDGIKNALSGGLLGGDEGGGGNFLSDAVGAVTGVFSSVGDFFGFAQGGAIEVPKGFPSDSFPARLSSGELVIDRSTSGRLKEFLENGGQAQSSGQTDTLLAMILDRLSGEQRVSTTVKLNDRAFADILIDLSRRGVRTTA